MSCEIFIFTTQGISSGLNSCGSYQDSIEHLPASWNKTLLESTIPV